MTGDTSGLAVLMDRATHDLDADPLRLARRGIARGRSLRRRRTTSAAAALVAIGGVAGSAALNAHRSSGPADQHLNAPAATQPGLAPRVIAPHRRLIAVLTSVRGLGGRLLPPPPLRGSGDRRYTQFLVDGKDLRFSIQPAAGEVCPEAACAPTDGGILLVEDDRATLWTDDGWRVRASGTMDPTVLTAVVTAEGYLVDPASFPVAPDPALLRPLVADEALVPTLRMLLAPAHQLTVTQTRFSGFGGSGLGKLIIVAVDRAEVSVWITQYNPRWRLDRGYDPMAALDMCDPALEPRCRELADGSVLLTRRPSPDGGVGIPRDNLSSGATLWTTDGWQIEVAAYNTTAEKSGLKVSDLPPLTVEEMTALVLSDAWFR